MAFFSSPYTSFGSQDSFFTSRNSRYASPTTLAKSAYTPTARVPANEVAIPEVSLTPMRDMITSYMPTFLPQYDAMQTQNQNFLNGGFAGDGTGGWSINSPVSGTVPPPPTAAAPAPMPGPAPMAPEPTTISPTSLPPGWMPTNAPLPGATPGTTLPGATSSTDLIGAAQDSLGLGGTGTTTTPKPAPQPGPMRPITPAGTVDPRAAQNYYNTHGYYSPGLGG